MKNLLPFLALRTQEKTQKMEQVHVFPLMWMSACAPGPPVAQWDPPSQMLEVSGPKTILPRCWWTEATVAWVRMTNKRHLLTTTRIAERHWSPTVTTHCQTRRNYGWAPGTACTYQWRNSNWLCRKCISFLMFLYHVGFCLDIDDKKILCASTRVSPIAVNDRWFYFTMICSAFFLTSVDHRQGYHMWEHRDARQWMPQRNLKFYVIFPWL